MTTIESSDSTNAPPLDLQSALNAAEQMENWLRAVRRLHEVVRTVVQSQNLLAETSQAVEKLRAEKDSLATEIRDYQSRLEAVRTEYEAARENALRGVKDYTEQLNKLKAERDAAARKFADDTAELEKSYDRRRLQLERDLQEQRQRLLSDHEAVMQDLRRQQDEARQTLETTKAEYEKFRRDVLAKISVSSSS